MRDPVRSSALEEMAAVDSAIVPVKLEVTNESDIAAVVQLIQEESGQLDLLINNAASFAHDEEGVHQTRAEEMLRVLSVNAVAPIIVVQHCIPLLERARAGGNTPVVATVSSGAALLRREMPEPDGQYSYAASKAALNVYLMKLAADMRERGILSIGLSPGFVLTDMTRAANLSPTLLPAESAAGLIAVLEKVTPDDAGKFFNYTGDQLDWFIG